MDALEAKEKRIKEAGIPSRILELEMFMDSNLHWKEPDMLELLEKVFQKIQVTQKQDRTPRASVKKKQPKKTPKAMKKEETK
jgi:hypothetical protein